MKVPEQRPMNSEQAKQARRKEVTKGRTEKEWNEPMSSSEDAHSLYRSPPRRIPGFEPSERIGRGKEA